MFGVAYYILLLFLYIIASPLLILLAILKKKYRVSIPARFFLYKNRKFQKDKSGIWFHACSFGEVKSLKPLINRIDRDNIYITTTTNTGIIEAKKLSKKSLFLPFEIFLPFWITEKRVLVVTEAELWYMLFFIAKRKGIKTLLINARLSDNSYKNYLKFAFFYKKIFENIDIVFAQSNRDRERLLKIGAKRVVVNGNIKASIEIKVTKKYQKAKREVVTIASSHEGEEELILREIKEFQNRVIFIVPRHPERFDRVDNFLKEFAKSKQLSYNRVSRNFSFNYDIILIDKMGELINIYAISDIVFLCGSFIDGIGGHNPIEPAYFNCKIVSGEYYFNQKTLYSFVKNIEIVNINSISKVIKNIDKIQYSKIIDKGDINPILKELN